MEMPSPSSWTTWSANQPRESTPASLAAQYFQALEVSVSWNRLACVSLLLSRGVIEKAEKWQAEIQKLADLAQSSKSKEIQDFLAKFAQNPQKVDDELRRDHEYERGRRPKGQLLFEEVTFSPPLWALLESVLPTQPHLTEIKISRCSLGSTLPEGLPRIIAHLETFEFADTPLRQEDLEAFLGCVAQAGSSKKRLRLHGNGLKGTEASVVLSQIAPLLTEFSIADNEVDPAFPSSVIPNLTAASPLNRIRIENCGVEAGSTLRLFQHLVQTKPADAPNPLLFFSTAERVGKKDEHRIFFEANPTQPAQTTLSLRNNQITLPSLEILFPLLSQFRELSFSNGLGMEETRLLSSGLKANTHLKFLRLENNGLTGDTFPLFTEAIARLEDFWIERNPIGDGGAVIIPTTLRESKSNRKIRVLESGMGAEGGLEVIHALIWNLENADFPLESLKMDDVKLGSFGGLERVSPEIQRQGTKAIAQFLQLARRVKPLRIPAGSISPPAAALLKADLWASSP